MNGLAGLRFDVEVVMDPSAISITSLTALRANFRQLMEFVARANQVGHQDAPQISMVLFEIEKLWIASFHGRLFNSSYRDDCWGCSPLCHPQSQLSEVT